MYLGTLSWQLCRERNFFREGEEKEYIYADITCEPWRKGADYRG